MNINSEAKEIAEKLKIDDRIEEDALYNLVHTIKFKRRPNSFQAKLAEDTKQITNSNMMLISADKTTNLYKIEVNNYKKLITDNITSAYCKADASATMNINSEAKEIAEKLKIDDRIEQPFPVMVPICNCKFYTTAINFTIFCYKFCTCGVVKFLILLQVLLFSTVTFANLPW